MKQLSITDLQILNKQFGDGFYLLDSDVFLNNYKNLTEEFKNHYSNFNIAYSYKTNYLPKLGKIVNEQGGFAEVVSEMELEIAKKAGVSFDRIIWNGPIKNREVLRAFLLNGGCSNIDNLDEWLYISDLVDKNTDKTFNVGIRCNFDVGDGVLSRFGVDTESVDFITICKGIASKKNVNLTSLQCHFAKRNSSYWQKRTQTMLDIYDRLKADFDLQAERIDLGGALSGDMSEDFAKQIGATSYGYKVLAFTFVSADLAKASYFLAIISLRANALRYLNPALEGILSNSILSHSPADISLSSTLILSRRKDNVLRYCFELIPR